jgi:hypothetical protein
MSISNAQIGVTVTSTGTNCSSSSCQNTCADFILKRHDTHPEFKVSLEDCDGALDLTDVNLVVEASMWVNVKLKTSITASDTYFRLADDVGFEQIMMDDVIVIDRVRLPEQMLVTGFDETNKLIRVVRGYHGTIPGVYKKGSALKVFRLLNAPGEIELVYEDILNVDGTTTEDQLSESYVLYRWQPGDTCVPGCFLFEFKLLQMVAPLTLNLTTPIVPSFTPSTLTPADFGCALGSGVEWERRFPSNAEGFIIQVVDSPTSEAL